MSMLAAPDTITGPLTAADLDAARQHSTGRVLHLHRVTVCPPCHGQCNQGRQCSAESCAPEGGRHAEPVPSGSALSMRQHRRTRATVALAMTLAVVGYLVRTAWPLLGA